MKKQSTKQMDMLNGSIMDKILIFALPLAASSILQQLFNSADVAVAGRFAGNAAQAAVGVNGSVISLLINLFVGLSVGANVVIANYIGQKKKNEVRETVHTAVTLAFISGFFLLVLGQFVARPILGLMNTPSNVLDQAVVYLRIYFLGMPFFMTYNFVSAILRSIGDTKRPMYALIISGILNVGLNLFFVVIMHLGAAGVAIATSISNGVSAGIVTWFLLHEEYPIRLDFKALSLKKSHLWNIMRIGVPAGIQGVVFSLSNTCIQSAINSFGDAAIAGSAAAVNFEFFTYFITSAFSQAAVTFTSQNFGAKQYDRCRKIFRMSMIGGLILTGIMSMAFVISREFTIRLFTVDQSAIEYALIRVVRVEILTCLPVTYEVAGAALRGIGYSMLPAVFTLIGSCGLRFLWVWIVFPRERTFEMLMNVYPLTWIFTGAAVLTAYFIIRRRVFRKCSGESKNPSVISSASTTQTT